MKTMTDMAGEPLHVGQRVWVEGVVGFPGEVMLAEVINLDASSDSGALRSSWARWGEVELSECVWVRQLPTAALPLTGADSEPWVTRWPARAILGR